MSGETSALCAGAFRSRAHCVVRSAPFSPRGAQLGHDLSDEFLRRHPISLRPMAHAASYSAQPTGVRQADGMIPGSTSTAASQPKSSAPATRRYSRIFSAGSKW